MRRVIAKYTLDICVCMAACAAYFYAAEIEAFEVFYDFSRSHEDWDLDEVALVYGIGAALFPFLLIRTNVRLRRAMSALSFAESEARHTAAHDALTGLYNRRYFNQMLSDALDHATPDKVPTVLVLDLDRFKSINDLRGHECGDSVLCVVSERILSSCREAQYVSRLGGDEFAVLLDDYVSCERSTRLAQRITEVLAEPVFCSGWVTTVGCSIGIYQWHEGDSTQCMVRNADQAMYKAKAKGGGCFEFFDEDLGLEVLNKALLEAELREAVDKMEIEPYFQPIINIDDGRICGFEVLARWTSPSLGNVPPNVFIQAAEEIGLIKAITWQLMHKALSEASKWDESLFIAFNLSPRLFDNDLLESIKWQLSETEVSATRIEFEVTENAIINNFDRARHTLDALKEIGFRISLDDFGTGHSSLATLSKLPFDKIKVDRSFVSGVESTPHHAKIVSAILALAHSLDLSVTAEGIETHAELDFLSDRACHQGQGYLFSKAMHANSVSDFIFQAEGLAPDSGQRSA